MEIDLEKIPFGMDFHPHDHMVAAALITGHLHLLVFPFPSYHSSFFLYISFLSYIFQFLFPYRYRYTADSLSQKRYF